MSLCNVCLVALPDFNLRGEDSIWEHDYKKHWKIKGERPMHTSWESFCTSLDTNCPICWSLWRQMRASPYSKPREQECEGFQSRACLLTYALGDLYENLQIKFGGPRSQDEKRADFSVRKVTKDQFQEAELQVPLDDSSLSESTLRTIETWLQSCTTHVKCLSRQTLLDNLASSQTVPTRLLDLGEPQSEIWSIVETKGDSNQYSKYIALSHRWANEVPKLESNGYQLHTEYMDNKLPPKYQDILTLCRKLSVRYVWIDSLCIFQDSKEDFQLEAATMMGVYRHAFLTLSICWNPEDGRVFTQRNTASIPRPMPDLNGNLLDEMESAEDPSTKDYAFVKHEQDLSVVIAEAPINQRGWVLQERTLSHRILYVGYEQLYWECDGLVASEAAPLGAIRRTFPQRRHSINDPIGDVDGLSWGTMVETYMEKSLSFEEDRLAAIAGIKHLFSLRTGDQYAAGIWVEYWQYDLLWQPQTERSRISATSRDPSPSPHKPPQVVPSWSWAACPGPISWMLGFSRDDHAAKNIASFESSEVWPLAILNRDSISLTSQDILGGLEGSGLEINCLLVPVMTGTFQLENYHGQMQFRQEIGQLLQRKAPGSLIEYSLRLEPSQWGGRSAHVHLNQPLDPSRPCFFIPLLYHYYNPKIRTELKKIEETRLYGLVIQEQLQDASLLQDQPNNELRRFTRIGSFSSEAILSRSQLHSTIANTILKQVPEKDPSLDQETEINEYDLFESRLRKFAKTEMSTPKDRRYRPLPAEVASSAYIEAEWTTVRLI